MMTSIDFTLVIHIFQALQPWQGSITWQQSAISLLSQSIINLKEEVQISVFMLGIREIQIPLCYQTT